MPTIKHLSSYLKKHRFSKKPLLFFAMMILFWSVFDGIMSYVAPLVIEGGGLSNTAIGIIIGTSSVAGALFDFISCRIFKSTFWKRMFLMMFVLCLVYPLILLKATTPLLYVIAMVIWGIYYDLKNIGEFDFVSRYARKNEYSESFGFIQVFQSVGYLIAPVFVGLMIAETLDWKPFVLSWIFLIIALLFFLILFSLDGKKKKTEIVRAKCRVSLWSETVLWEKIGKIIFPVLALSLFLNIIDSFFWTIGPLFAESMAEIHQFAGFFMTAYLLPALLVGWFVGKVTRKYGKKKTAFVSVMIGSILLMPLFLIDSPFLVIGEIFFASMFIALSWPAINGAYADYIHETSAYEKEIETLEDFCGNLGYIFGPILAGVISDRLGNGSAFGALGVIGFFVAAALLLITPKKINVGKRLKGVG
jgi:MFS family permease